MEKVVFCGFGKLGKECLSKLIDMGYEISLVLTHKENLEDSVDTFARKNKINYYYNDLRKNLESEINNIRNTIKDIKPKYLISINYRYIIPKDIFSMAEYAINIHGSLLPAYRGRTPHVWSIINGEKESGITCHIIEESVDTGDIITQKVIKIEDKDTGYTLLKKYEKSYPEVLIESLEKLNKNTFLKKQNELYASYYGKRTPDMGYIDFRKDAREVINFIRAQAEPYPGAYYYLNSGKKIIINKVIIDNDFYISELKIGVIYNINNTYHVKCKDSILKILDYRVLD